MDLVIGVVFRGANGAMHFREIPGPGGICDVVVVDSVL